jgi:hypothetical protein
VNYLTDMRVYGPYYVDISTNKENDMADTTLDDVYDDPDNILADTDDSVDGAVELPKGEQGDLSQSIYVPERGNDPRGRIDELEGADDNDSYEEMTLGHPEDTDADSTRLGDVGPDEERDGSEA